MRITRNYTNKTQSKVRLTRMSYRINGHRVLLRITQGLLLAAFLCLSFVAVPAQDPKPTKSSADQDEIIKINSNLINVDVMVKDKKGKAVTNLKAEDFTIIENGVKQNVEFFESPLADG